jgi:hypothetical protein
MLAAAIANSLSVSTSMIAFASGVGGRTPAARKAASDDMMAFNFSPGFRTADGLLSTTRGVFNAVPQCGSIKKDNHRQVLDLGQD